MRFLRRFGAQIQAEGPAPGRVRRLFITAFSVVFLLVMAVHVGVIAASNHAAVTLAGLAMGAGLLLGAHYLAAPLNKLAPKKVNAAIGLCLLLLFAVLFITGDGMKSALPSDTDIVYQSVADVLDDGRLNGVNPNMEHFYPEVGLVTNSDYFVRYPNNILLLTILTALYGLFGVFGVQAGTAEGQTLGIGLASLCVALSVLFLCLAVRRYFAQNSLVLFTFLLCVLFLPYYYGVANFYTDILVLCPVSAALWCAALAKGRAGRRAFVPLGLSGAFSGVAMHIKATAAIFVVAALILVLLYPSAAPLRQKLGRLAAFGLPFLLFTAGFLLWYRRCPWLDYSNEAALSLPFQMWICFGSHSNGTFAIADVRFALAIEDVGERSRAVWQRIGEYYAGYSFEEFLQLLHTKLVWTWNNGHFDGSAYTRWPLEVNWTVFFTQPDQIGYIVCYWFGQAYMQMLYLGGLAGAAVGLLRRKADFGFYCNLCIFGVMLYLQIFEPAPRRALIVMPFFLLNMVWLAFKTRKITPPM